MGFNYLVIGTGVGEAISRYLLQQTDTDNVTIADVDFERARALRHEIFTLYEIHGQVRALELNVAEVSDELLAQAIGSFDVVISAIPAHLNPRIALAAIAAGTHYTDLGGVIETTREIKELSADAVKAGVSVFPDNGFMPGLGNIQLQRLLDLLRPDGPVSASITAGAVPLLPEPPSNYLRTFSLAGLKHFCYGEAPVLLGGDVLFVPPMKHMREVPVPDQLTALCPEFKHMETFPTSGASLAPWDLPGRGVQNFVEWTLRWPGFVEYVRNIPEDKFEELMGELPVTDQRNPDLVYMDVTVEELKSHKPRKASYRLLEQFDPETGFSALARTTGYPAAIMARFQAQGRIEPGVWTPDTGMDEKTRQDYLDEVKQSVPFTFHANHDEL